VQLTALSPALFPTLSANRQLLACSWSRARDWGADGTFKIAYGSAYIMQPDYTYAVQFTKSSITARTAEIKQQLKQAMLVYDNGASGCAICTLKQSLRLAKLAGLLSKTLLITSFGAHMGNLSYFYKNVRCRSANPDEHRATSQTTSLS
jgi:hypothetical protein